MDVGLGFGVRHVDAGPSEGVDADDAEGEQASEKVLLVQGDAESVVPGPDRISGG